MIGQIDPAVTKEKTDRIIEHFYGVFVGESWFDPNDEYVVKKARELEKLVSSGGGSKTCEVADSLLLKPVKCGICIHKVNEELTKIMENATQMIEVEENQSGMTENLQEDDRAVCIAPTLELSSNPETKAVVCLTQKRKTAETIAHARPRCPIIVLTECPSIAKRLQMWRNVSSMVYVDCGNKNWKDKKIEMMQVVLVFGKEMNIFDSEELLVTCCYPESNCIGTDDVIV